MLLLCLLFLVMLCYVMLCYVIYIYIYICIHIWVTGIFVAPWAPLSARLDWAVPELGLGHPSKYTRDLAVIGENMFVSLCFRIVLTL